MAEFPQVTAPVITKLIKGLQTLKRYQLTGSPKKSGPPLPSGPESVPNQEVLQLLQWGGYCLAAPKLVGEYHAHRVNVGVVIEFEASGDDA